MGVNGLGVWGLGDLGFLVKVLQGCRECPAELIPLTIHAHDTANDSEKENGNSSGTANHAKSSN